MYQQYDDLNTMPSFEIIEGTKLLALLEFLISDKKLVNVSVPNSTCDLITVITQLYPDNHPLQLRLEPTEDFIICCGDHPLDSMMVAFSGPDHLLYRFEAESLKSTIDAIWLKIPSHIHRFQQRDNVRIKPGTNSHMQTVIDGKAISLPIQDISTGGVLCHCPNACRQMIDLEKEWSDVQLVLISGMDEYHLSIRKLAIIRKIKGVRPKHFSIAFVFKKIDASNRNKLQNVIYMFQRKALRKRQLNQGEI